MPQEALAHGVLKGVGDFYAGLLHPIVVPAELLAIAAMGLLVGRSGLAACRRGIPMLAAGVAVGLGLASVVATSGTTTPLVVAALVAGAIVTAGQRVPPWVAAGLAALAGTALGIDAAPEAKSHIAAVTSGVATIVGSTALATIIAALALRVEKHWQHVAAQVAGSWITAWAMLYFAYQLALLSR